MALQLKLNNNVLEELQLEVGESSSDESSAPFFLFDSYLIVNFKSKKGEPRVTKFFIKNGYVEEKIKLSDMIKFQPETKQVKNHVMEKG